MDDNEKILENRNQAAARKKSTSPVDSLLFIQKLVLQHFQLSTDYSNSKP